VTARRAALALVAALVALPGTARAVSTVAVMPFKDLSGEKGSIGEAIRETVTSDLKDVPGIKVIERSNIDAVLAEQNLQSIKSDLDPLSTVRVGKLLGATLIVAGAYQKADKNVRLTARFVRVETGEIVGTAKVDGAAAEFLSLQDKVTAQLLRSAGIAQAHVQKFAARKRPKLKTLRTVELYGDAVVETDDEKKVEYLKQALDADPNFSYAVRDLDELQQRMKKYEAVAERELDKKTREMHAALEKETDPDKRANMQMQYMAQLVSARRYRTLRAEARRVAERPLEKSKSAPVDVNEIAAFYVVQASSFLHDHDAVLGEGERFLKRYPASMYFKVVESQMQQSIDKKRQMEDGKAKAADELGKLNSRERWDLCRLAQIYDRAAQFKEAQRLYRACIEAGVNRAPYIYSALVRVETELADWAAAKRDLAAMDKLGPEAQRLRSSLEFSVPSD
jgi:TolB-like protein